LATPQHLVPDDKSVQSGACPAPHHRAMTIQIIKNSPRRGDLVDSGAVARPLSQPACTTRTLKLAEATAGDRMGVWECSAGSYMRQVAEGELMHILSGRCTFTPEGGAPMAIEAGDTVFFPPQTKGRWDMQETLRKVYVVFSPS
jgi:uncharacterized cupin superfamily protein